MNDGFRVALKLKSLATRQLVEMVWHNLRKVKNLCAGVLGLDLGEIGQVAKAITNSSRYCSQERATEGWHL